MWLFYRLQLRGTHPSDTCIIARPLHSALSPAVQFTLVLGFAVCGCVAKVYVFVI
jgi:hypothetical protein